jgi:hypothetical protein
MSWGLRSLFNRPETVTLLRATCDEDGDRYWTSVLDHCWDGGLTAVLDEYAHPGGERKVYRTPTPSRGLRRSPRRSLTHSDFGLSPTPSTIFASLTATWSRHGA